MGSVVTARTYRKCDDCPKEIAALGNRKRCDDCQEKKEKERKLAKDARKRQIKQLERVASTFSLVPSDDP